MKHVNAWPAFDVQTAQMMWTLGSSASEIAETLGRTKSAVIGKIHRLGLSGEDKAGYAQNKAALEARKEERRQKRLKRMSEYNKKRLPRLPKGKKINRMPPESPPVPPLNISMLELDRTTCRFICDDVTSGVRTNYCGHKTYDESPYCAHHFRVCYKFAVKIEPVKPKPKWFSGVLDESLSLVPAE